jgi:hypothetical protein
MGRRRWEAARLSKRLCCHTFRAAGITVYRANGGSLEDARIFAACESPKRTKFQDRSKDRIALDEIERIVV